MKQPNNEDEDVSNTGRIQNLEVAMNDVMTGMCQTRTEMGNIPPSNHLSSSQPSDHCTNSKGVPSSQSYLKDEQRHFKILYSVFVLSAIVTFFCVSSLLPDVLWNVFPTSASRRMSEVASDSAVSCVKCAATGTSIGTIVGLAAVPVLFVVVGLSPLGPLAGGWFASNMGAGLAAGSTMAGLQSAAMTGAGYGTAAAVGGAVGTGVAASTCC